MNSLAGPLFDRRIARRRPLKSSIKTLVELGTPEAVPAEEQHRLIEAVVGGLEVSKSAKPPDQLFAAADARVGVSFGVKRKCVSRRSALERRGTQR